MKKKTFLRCVACILMIVSIFSIALPASAAGSSLDKSVKINFGSSENASGNNIKGSFEFVPSISLSRGSLEGQYYYRDAYFTAPSTVYNSHLATMSMALTLSSFWADDAWNLYMQYDNAIKLLSEVGFEHFEANYETDGRPTAETIGILMSHKTIVDTDGTTCNLVTINVRSSGYGSEWANNMIIGTESDYNGNHKGFSMARDRALEFIIPYLEKHVEGNTKIWITGFSRGGAVGGLLGAWMDDNISTLREMNINATRNDIFTYTFESPATMLRKNTVGKEYGNIFNIVSTYDPIIYLPLSGSKENGWDFVQPGVVRKYTNPTQERIVAIERELHKLSPYYDYKLDEFSPFMNPLGKDLSTFLANFSAAFAAKVDRNTYANSIERDFARLTEQFMAGSDEETEEMFGRLSELLMERLGMSESDSMAEIVSMLISVLGGNDEAIESLCKILGESMEEVGAIEVYDDMAHRCLKTLLRTLLSTEGGNIVPYIITIIINTVTFTDSRGREKSTNMVFSGHAPEIVFAQLIADDTYYKSSPLINFLEAGSEDIVTVAVTVGEKRYHTNYDKGEEVVLSAEASGCYEFDAWILDGVRVCEESSYSFVADKPLTLGLELKSNHVPSDDWVIEKEATGNEDGMMVKLCSSCGDVAVSELIPKLNQPLAEPDEPKAPDTIDQSSGGVMDNYIVAIAVLSVVAIVAFGGGMGLIIFVISRKRHKKSKQ